MFGIVRALGFFFSALWIGICAFYIQRSVGFSHIFQVPAGDMGLIMVGVFLPLVLIWSLLVARAKERHSRLLLAQKIDSLRKVQILPDTLDNHIAAITEAFHQRAREFHGTAEETLGTFAQMSAAYEEQNRNMAALSAALQEQRLHMDAMFDQQASALHKNQTKTETLFAAIEGTTQAAHRVGQEISHIIENDLNRANQALNDSAGNVKGVANEIWDQLKNIETAYSASQEMAEAARSALQQQAHEIGHVTSQAVNEVDRFAEKLEPKISQIEEMGSHAAEMTAAIHRQMESQRESMEGVGQALTRKAEELQISVKEQAGSLEMLLDNFDQRSSSLALGFESRVNGILKTADEAGQMIEQKISEASQGLQESTGELGSTVVARLNEMQTQAAGFEEKLQGQVNGLIDHLDQRIYEAGQTIVRFENSLIQASDQATSTVGHVVTNYASQLDQASARAMESVMTVARELPIMTRSIGDSADVASRQLQNAGGDIAAQSQHLARAAADLMSYGDQIRNDLQRLPSELQQVVSGLDEKVHDVSHDIISTYSQVEAQVLTTTHQFEQSKATLQYKLADFGNLYEEMQSFAQQIESNISEQTLAVDRATAKAKLSWQEAQKAMQLHANETVEFSEDYIVNVSRASEAARREVEELSELSATAIGSVQTTSHAVGGQLREFADSVNSLRDLVNSVGGAAAQHRKALSDASLVTEKKAEQMSRQLLASQKDTFLKSVGTLVGQLHQAAIDVDKIMMGELAPEVIQAFQTGDTSVSVRRLLKNSTSEQAGRVQQLYRNDASFNTAVEAYVNTFQDVLDQAKESDPSKLLHTTFLTGDLGKLYVFLSQSLGQLEAA